MKSFVTIHLTSSQFLSHFSAALPLERLQCERMGTSYTADDGNDGDADADDNYAMNIIL